MAYNTAGPYATSFRSGVYNTWKSNISAVGVLLKGCTLLCGMVIIIGGSRGQSGHAPIMVLGRGSPLPRLHIELLKVGGSWRLAVFSLASLAIILII